MEQQTNILSQSASAKAEMVAPRLYDYLDHKVYLRDYYSFKKQIDQTFSYGVFARMAKFSSRNYLKRLIDGERPVTPEILPRIATALGLDAKESLYFECMVRYSQSKDLGAKEYYLQQLRASAQGVDGSAAHLMEQQFEILGEWYFLPLWEYCDLDADQTPEKVSRVFRGRITAAQVKSALALLEKTGLIHKPKNSTRYLKTQKMIRYHRDTINLAVRNFHKKMMNLTTVSIDEDSLDDRYMRALTIAVGAEEVSEVRKEIDNFFQHLNKNYSNSKAIKDLILQVNIQALNLTEIIDIKKKDEKK